MKFLPLLLCIFSFDLMAQIESNDFIYLKNKTIIEAQILDIGAKEITYLKEDKTLKIAIKEVIKVRSSTGEERIFDNLAIPKSTKTEGIFLVTPHYSVGMDMLYNISNTGGGAKFVTPVPIVVLQNTNISTLSGEKEKKEFINRNTTIGLDFTYKWKNVTSKNYTDVSFGFYKQFHLSKIDYTPYYYNTDYHDNYIFRFSNAGTKLSVGKYFDFKYFSINTRLSGIMLSNIQKKKVNLGYLPVDMSTSTIIYRGSGHIIKSSDLKNKVFAISPEIGISTPWHTGIEISASLLLPLTPFYKFEITNYVANRESGINMVSLSPKSFWITMKVPIKIFVKIKSKVRSPKIKTPKIETPKVITPKIKKEKPQKVLRRPLFENISIVPLKSKGIKTVKLTPKQPVQIKKSNVITQLNGTKVELAKVLTLKSPNITITYWDDQVEDGDIMSLNLNNNWVLKAQKVTKVSKNFKLTLSEKENLLVMYADNLGRYSPNTAAIEINDGVSKHRFILKSDKNTSQAIKLLVE